jgi:MFS family permease
MPLAGEPTAVLSRAIGVAGPPSWTGDTGSVEGKGSRPLAIEGFFQSVAQGLGETYLSALMVWLGAGGVILGLAGTVPTAATAFSQILAARCVAGKHAGRAFIARSWLLQGAALATLGCFVLLPSTRAVPLVCAGAVVAWFLAGLSVPAWTSLVSKTVPRLRHGHFFGLRGAAQQVGVVLAILAGGALLSAADSMGKTSLGFVLVFGLAGIFRMLGAAFLIGVPERGRLRQGPTMHGILPMLGTSAKFRRLAVYLWSFHFATWVAAPFFLPYMLEDLGFDYGMVGILVAVPAIVKVLTMRWWGKVADRVGPGPLLRSMGWYVLPVSAMWLLSDNFWWIMAAQIYAGFAWGAFELAQASALLQTTRGREDAVALFNAVDGAVMILGSVAGGMIVMGAGRVLGTGFLTAIAFSTGLRTLTAILLLRRVRKIGAPGVSHNSIPMRLWGVRAARGATFRPWGRFPEAANGRHPEDDAP